MLTSGMEKREATDEFEPGPVPPLRPVDKFGFVKQEQNNSQEGPAKIKPVNEHERSVLHFGVSIFFLYYLPLLF